MSQVEQVEQKLRVGAQLRQGDESKGDESDNDGRSLLSIPNHRLPCDSGKARHSYRASYNQVHGRCCMSLMSLMPLMPLMPLSKSEEDA